MAGESADVIRGGGPKRCHVPRDKTFFSPSAELTRAQAEEPTSQYSKLLPIQSFRPVSAAAAALTTPRCGAWPVARCQAGRCPAPQKVRRNHPILHTHTRTYRMCCLNPPLIALVPLLAPQIRAHAMPSVSDEPIAQIR